MIAVGCMLMVQPRAVMPRGFRFLTVSRRVLVARVPISDLEMDAPCVPGSGQDRGIVPQRIPHSPRQIKTSVAHFGYALHVNLRGKRGCVVWRAIHKLPLSIIKGTFRERIGSMREVFGRSAKPPAR